MTKRTEIQVSYKKKYIFHWMSFRDFPCMQIAFVSGMQDIKRDSSKIKSTCFVLKTKFYSRYLWNETQSSYYVPKGFLDFIWRNKWMKVIKDFLGKKDEKWVGLTLLDIKLYIFKLQLLRGGIHTRINIQMNGTWFIDLIQIWHI